MGRKMKRDRRIIAQALIHGLYNHGFDKVPQNPSYWNGLCEAPPFQLCQRLRFFAACTKFKNLKLRNIRKFRGSIARFKRGINLA